MVLSGILWNGNVSPKQTMPIMATSCNQIVVGFFVLLLFYILATDKVISAWVPDCDSAHHHSWGLYNSAPLGNQVVSSISYSVPFS